MIWKTPNNVKDELYTIYQKGLPRGNSVGWNWDKYYTCLKGTTTYWGGLSSHGKSYMLFNVLRNLTNKHGWKHAIFSPEMDSADRILARLIHIHSGQEMNANRMNEETFYRWTSELEQYYRILELKDNELTLDSFIIAIKELMMNENVDTITLDPFNELRHNFTQHGGREDKYLEDRLTEIRRIAMDYNVHINIVAHARSDKGGLRGTHPKQPSMYEFSGGESFANKAMNVICVYRPQEHDGISFPKHNKTQIFFQKIKPQEVGERGMTELFYDKEMAQFYYIDNLNQRKYD